MFAWVGMSAAAFLSAQDQPIDTARSTITIHVGKAGLFSAAGHEHWIAAPISSGVLHESAPAHVEFKIETADMRVKPDSKIDAKTQAEIQKDMQEKVLQIASYPEITFRSSRVEKQSATEWRVEGVLTLHGAMRPVIATVRRDGSFYVGQTTLKQTEFGIKPIRAAGGTIKVRDELGVEFHLAPLENPRQP